MRTGGVSPVIKLDHRRETTEMTESNEVRANTILTSLDHVMAALPPEMRQLIEDVLSGTTDIDANASDRSPVKSAIDRLSSFFDECDFEAFGEEKQVIALAWWAVINRQVKAIRSLVEAGLESEALPNVRVAFEYAMALVTLCRADPDDMFVALLANLMSDLTKLPTGTEDQNLEFRDAVGKARLELDSVVTDRWIAGFTRRSNSLQVDDRVNYYYRTLSMFIHPTIMAVMAFSELNEKQSAAKTANVTLRVLTGDPLNWAIQCQCWSALAINHIVVGELSWRAELQKVIDEFEIPYADTLFPLT